MFLPYPSTYLLYRVLEPLGPYIVGTWRDGAKLRLQNSERCGCRAHGVKLLGINFWVLDVKRFSMKPSAGA